MKKCKECGHEIEDDKIKIVSRYNLDKVLFQSTKTTIKEAVIEAKEKGANLRGAGLQNADLQNADLQNADLRGANLQNADLRGANLQYADLRGAKTVMCIINFRSCEYKQAKQFIEGLKL